jgi:hypothetical protein
MGPVPKEALLLKLIRPLNVDQGVASATVCDAVAVQAAVFVPDYGNEDDNHIQPHICSRCCASPASFGSLAQAA